MTDSTRPSMFRKWRLNRTRRALEDAIHDRDKWGFADRPSEEEDRKKRIHKLIRRLHSLGGDIFDVVDWDDEYLICEALPDLYEWTRQPGHTQPYWRAEPRT